MFDDEMGLGETSLTSHKPKKRHFKKRTARLKDPALLGHRHAMHWNMDADHIETPFKRAENAIDIQDLKDFLSNSETARQMIYDENGDLHSNIIFDDQTIVSQFYPAQNTIVLNPDRPIPELACVLVKEMRRAWQHKKDHLYNPLDFMPDQAILVNRAQQADSLMMAVKVAWELKLLNQNDMWNFMMVAPFADVTRTFEIFARNDFRTLKNGLAGRAAYDKWFDDQRTRIHDKRLIHQMLLEDSHSAQAENRQIRVLNDQMLRQMAHVPNGENYMNLAGYRAPMDEEYMGVDDRSNANFLWFVKFERNFIEQEAAMLDASVEVSAEIIDFQAQAKALRPSFKPS